MDISRSVEQHYGFGGLLSRILDGLKSAGKDPACLTVDDLAPVDAFHTRGHVSTSELVELSPPQPGDSVLDIGCGLGGSARQLASRYGCQVTGIDLTREYIEVAKQLTGWVGLQDRVRLVHGSALDLPFPDARFDKVWTEHAQMNIADKPGFYNEIARVLKPHGHLLFHDIFAGSGTPEFPLPWASDAAISSLASETRARTGMEQAGLRSVCWIDKVDDSLAAFRKSLDGIRRGETPPCGVHLLMGDTARQKIENMVTSLSRGNLSVAMGVAVKTTQP